jgi:hypothetical protein
MIADVARGKPETSQVVGVKFVNSCILQRGEFSVYLVFEETLIVCVYVCVCMCVYDCV